MPGPGGGSRGGGFGGGSRGGGFGGGSHGGFGGGGFHGGPRGPRGPHYHGGWHYGGWGHRHYYGGGGCLGGLVGMLLFPIIILLMAGMFIFSFIGSSFGNVTSGGQVVYDEAAFQNYANVEYAKAFGDSSAYEDNLLLVFLTNEAADGYYTIAWIGDNVDTRISNMFGDETTEYGVAVLGNVSGEYYAYSLDTSLAAVVETMIEKISRLGLESSFRKSADRSKMSESKLVNYTALALTESTVEDALDEFTASTEIPIVIVVEDMETVFGKTVRSEDWVGFVISLVFVALAVYLIVKAVKERKKGGNGNNSSSDNGTGGGYNSYEYK